MKTRACSCGLVHSSSCAATVPQLVSQHVGEPNRDAVTPSTAVLTGFPQQLKHAARRFVGDGSLSLHLVFPHSIPGGDLVFGLNQNQSGLVQELEDLLGLPLIQFLANLEFWETSTQHNRRP